MDKGKSYLAGRSHVLRNKGCFWVRDRVNVLLSRVRDGIEVIAGYKQQAAPDQVRDLDSFISELGDDTLERLSVAAIRLRMGTRRTYEVVVASPHAEEKVRVGLCARGNELTAGKHNLDANNVVNGEANFVAKVVQA